MVTLNARIEAGRRERRSTGDTTRQMTGAMVQVIERCPTGNELGWVTTVFDVLNDSHIGPKHREVLLWTLGLDGDEIAPRDVHQAQKRFDFISNSATLQFLDGTMHEVRRIGGLPDALDFLWLRRFIVNLRTDHAGQSASPPSPVNARPASRAAAATQERFDVSEIVKPRSDAIMAMCTTDHQRWFFRCFFETVAMIGAMHAEHMFYRYGIDADGLAQSVRSYGALVEHFGKKFRTADDAFKSIHANWTTLHASGLPGEINEKTLLSRLNELRLGLTPAPSASPTVVPRRPETATRPFPEPPVSDLPAAERDEMPDHDVRPPQEGSMPRKKGKSGEPVELTPKEHEVYEALRAATERAKPPQNLKEWAVEKFGDSVSNQWQALRKKGVILKEGQGRYTVADVSVAETDGHRVATPKAKTTVPTRKEDHLHAAVTFFSNHRDLLAKQDLILAAAEHLKKVEAQGWRLVLEGNEVHLVLNTH